MFKRLEVPFSALRCTVVDFDTMRRCVMLENHGGSIYGSGGNHYFENDVRQDICLETVIWKETGKLRTCALPLDHIGDCVFLWLTERTVTIADVLPIRRTDDAR